MVKNGSLQTGDVYLEFNGRDSYVEIPNISDYSASTTGELTIAAWIRPDTLNFPSVERNSAYIHWLGKGKTSGAAGNSFGGGWIGGRRGFGRGWCGGRIGGRRGFGRGWCGGRIGGRRGFGGGWSGGRIGGWRGFGGGWCGGRIGGWRGFGGG